MRALVLSAVLVLTACSSGRTTSHAASPNPTMSSAASASRSDVASPARTVSPTAIPLPAVTVTTAGKSLACRLPLTWEVELDPYTYVYEAGFLSFPSGRLTEDPSALTTAFNKRVQFYDRAYSKWLPVWRQDVSPDGRYYAYTEGNPASDTRGKLHLVDIATGADRVLYSGSPVYWVTDFTAEGIFVSAGVGGSRSLWLENPAGGLPRLITRSIAYPVIAGGAAWGLAFNPADTHPGPGGIDGPWNELTRLDLVTGASTTLFYRPGTTMRPLGVDQSGNLFVGVWTGLDGPEEIWLMTPATTMRKLGTYASTGPSSVAAADRHGVWFTNLWLYTGGAFLMVASGPVQPAGGCIP